MQTNLETLITTIYEQHCDMLLSYGYGLGFAREDVEDCIHEVFIGLYRSGSVESIRDIRYYLLRSLKNRLLNTRRHDKHLVNSESVDIDFRTVVSIQDEMMADEERHQMEQRLQQMMQTLTPRQREAVYLRYMQELDYPEVAQLLNMTVPSVRNLIFRALQHMRRP